VRRELLDWLVCPTCRGPELALTVEDEDPEGDVSAGSISCAGCGEVYPVERGVPRLLPPGLRPALDERVAEASKEQLEAYRTEATPAVARLLDSLSREAQVTLDIGSGRGPYLGVLRGDVICVDIVPEFLYDLLGRDHGNARVHPVCASATDLPFRPGVADLVFASEVIEHLTPGDADRALETWPVYARKWCVIDTPNGEEGSLLTKLRHLLYRTRTLTAVEHPDLPELDHHSTFSPHVFREAGYECHGCIGWVSRKRFRLGPLWDVYDAIAWRVPAIGGTLVAIARRRGEGTLTP
jgi:uncharacterized protein YbaR (Trm112 family)